MEFARWWTAQIKYEWDYLYGSLEVTGGECHFCQISGVNLQWDRRYLEDLASNDPEAVHILIRDQAGFHLRDGAPPPAGQHPDHRPAALQPGAQPL